MIVAQPWYDYHGFRAIFCHKNHSKTDDGTMTEPWFNTQHGTITIVETCTMVRQHLLNHGLFTMCNIVVQCFLRHATAVQLSSFVPSVPWHKQPS